MRPSFVSDEILSMTPLGTSRLTAVRTAGGRSLNSLATFGSLAVVLLLPNLLSEQPANKAAAAMVISTSFFILSPVRYCRTTYSPSGESQWGSFIGHSTSLGSMREWNCFQSRLNYGGAL